MSGRTTAMPPPPTPPFAALAATLSSGSLHWSSAEGRANRVRATLHLQTWLRAAPLDDVRDSVQELAKVLYAPLLDIGQLHIFALSTQAVAGVAIRLGDGALPLVEALMPLLIDLSQSTGAASAVGGHAHCAVCAVLPRVSSYDAIPPLLSALDRSTASSVARARSTEQLLLALSAVGAGGGGAGGGGAGGGGGGGGGGSGSGGSGGSGGASNALRGKRAASIASVLCARLHDPNASTRRLARHALLVLMEASPRVASEPFATLPLRTQRQLTSVAKCRAAPIGPPLLPPPPPPSLPAGDSDPGGRSREDGPKDGGGGGGLRLVAEHGRSAHGVLERRRAPQGGELRPPGRPPGHPALPRQPLRLRARVMAWDRTRSASREVRRGPSGHTLLSYCAETRGHLRAAVGSGAHPPPSSACAHAADDHGIGVTLGHQRSIGRGGGGGGRGGGGGGGGDTCKLHDAGAILSRGARSSPHPADALTPGPPRATNDDAPATKQLPMKTLVESHKRALASLTALCDGQNALVRATELACRVGGGEAGRAQYLQQMEILCMQQKLIASQMVDAIQAERAAAAAAAPGRE